MDTFKDRLVFLWKDEARQAKIAADIDMTMRDLVGFGTKAVCRNRKL